MGGLGGVFNEFAGWSSIPLMGVYAGTRGCFVRGIWLAAVALGVALFAVQADALVRQFHRYEKTTSVKLVYDGTVDFPAVTICSLNPYKLSKLKEAPSLSALMTAYSFYSQTRRGSVSELWEGREAKRSAGAPPSQLWEAGKEETRSRAKRSVVPPPMDWESCRAALGSEDALMRDNVCFLRHSAAMNFSQWDQHCRAGGGKIAEPISDLHIPFVLRAFTGVYMGIRMIPTEPGQWVWGSNTSLAWTKVYESQSFEPGLPYNDTAKTCAINGFSGLKELLVAVDCSSLHAGLCMFYPPSPAHCASEAAAEAKEAQIVADYGGFCFLLVSAGSGRNRYVAERDCQLRGGTLAYNPVGTPSDLAALSFEGGWNDGVWVGVARAYVGRLKENNVDWRWPNGACASGAAWATGEPRTSSSYARLYTTEAGLTLKSISPNSDRPWICAFPGNVTTDFSAQSCPRAVQLDFCGYQSEGAVAPPLGEAASLLSDTPTAAQCDEVCAADAACQGFVHDDSGGLCWLFGDGLGLLPRQPADPSQELLSRDGLPCANGTQSSQGTPPVPCDWRWALTPHRGVPAEAGEGVYVVEAVADLPACTLLCEETSDCAAVLVDLANQTLCTLVSHPHETEPYGPGGTFYDTQVLLTKENCSVLTTSTSEAQTSTSTSEAQTSTSTSESQTSTSTSESQTSTSTSEGASTTTTSVTMTSGSSQTLAGCVFDVERDTDVDLSEGNHSRLASSSADLCAAACVSDELCGGFLLQHDQGTCALFRTASEPRLSRPSVDLYTRQSGSCGGGGPAAPCPYAELSGRGPPGNGSLAIHMGNWSVGECLGLCDEDAQCAGAAVRRQEACHPEPVCRQDCLLALHVQPSQPSSDYDLLLKDTDCPNATSTTSTSSPTTPGLPPQDLAFSGCNFTLQENTGPVGSLDPSKVVGSVSPDICAEACLKDSSCTGFLLQESQGVCHLLSDSVNRTAPSAGLDLYARREQSCAVPTGPPCPFLVVTGLGPGEGSSVLLSMGNVSVGECLALCEEEAGCRGAFVGAGVCEACARPCVLAANASHAQPDPAFRLLLEDHACSDLTSTRSTSSATSSSALASTAPSSASSTSLSTLPSTAPSSASSTSSSALASTTPSSASSTSLSTLPPSVTETGGCSFAEHNETGAADFDRMQTYGIGGSQVSCVESCAGDPACDGVAYTSGEPSLCHGFTNLTSQPSGGSLLFLKLHCSTPPTTAPSTSTVTESLSASSASVGSSAGGACEYAVEEGVMIWPMHNAFGVLASTDAALCRAACDAEPACTGFVMDETWGTCNLLNEDTSGWPRHAQNGTTISSKSNSSCNHGEKIECYWSSGGNGFSPKVGAVGIMVQLDDESMASCMEACLADEDCEAAYFHWRNSTCTLTSDESESQWDDAKQVLLSKPAHTLCSNLTAAPTLSTPPSSSTSSSLASTASSSPSSSSSPFTAFASSSFSSASSSTSSTSSVSSSITSVSTSPFSSTTSSSSTFAFSTPPSTASSPTTPPSSPALPTSTSSTAETAASSTLSTSSAISPTSSTISSTSFSSSAVSTTAIGPALSTASSSSLTSTTASVAQDTSSSPQASSTSPSGSALASSSAAASSADSTWSGTSSGGVSESSSAPSVIGNTASAGGGPQFFPVSSAEVLPSLAASPSPTPQLTSEVTASLHSSATTELASEATPKGGADGSTTPSPSAGSLPSTAGPASSTATVRVTGSTKPTENGTTTTQEATDGTGATAAATLSDSEGAGETSATVSSGSSDGALAATTAGVVGAVTLAPGTFTVPHQATEGAGGGSASSLSGDTSTRGSGGSSESAAQAASTAGGVGGVSLGAGAAGASPGGGGPTSAGSSAPTDSPDSSLTHTHHTSFGLVTEAGSGDEAAETQSTTGQASSQVNGGTGVGGRTGTTSPVSQISVSQNLSATSAGHYEATVSALPTASVTPVADSESSAPATEPVNSEALNSRMTQVTSPPSTGWTGVTKDGEPYNGLLDLHGRPFVAGADPPLHFDVSSLSPWEYGLLEAFSESVVEGVFGAPGSSPPRPSQTSVDSLIRQRTREVAAGLEPDVLRSISHSLSDLVSSCLIDGHPCDVEEDFEPFLTPDHGYCYTFNGRHKYRSIKPGSNFGLDMVIKSNVSEHIFTSDKAGISVSIHPQGVVPFPAVLGRQVGLGSQKDFTMRFSQLHRLPAPYGQCVPEPRMERFLFPKNYTLEGCIRSCTQARLVVECGCADARYPAPPAARLCSTARRDDYACVRRFQAAEQEAATKATCDCGEPCDGERFGHVTSQVAWPAPRAKVAGCSDAEIAQYRKPCREIMRENAAKVRIFFDQVNYEIVEETPAFLGLDLYFGLVNSVALWLGFSFVSIVELLIFALHGLLALLSPLSLRGIPPTRGDGVPSQARLAPRKSVYFPHGHAQRRTTADF